MFSPNVVGHTNIREKLFSRYQNGKLPGSLIFQGPPGIGKRRVALELVQRELCLTKNACGTCVNCRTFTQANLPFELSNMLRVVPEGKAGIIRVKQIRNGLDSDDKPRFSKGVLDWANEAPPKGYHRWVIIEDAHQLKDVGNILLKSLEEPSPGIHFILISHKPEAILQTIRSRSERFNFSPLGDEEAWSIAKQYNWQEHNKDRWLALSSGSMALLDENLFDLTVARVEAWLALMNGQPFNEVAKPLLPSASYPDIANNEQIRQSLELLLLVMWNIMRIRHNSPISLKPWSDALTKIANKKIDLALAQEVVFKALQSLFANPNAESLIREVSLSIKG